MATSKVIVFGPTGAVGSAAARTAASLGVQVTLAMRDTSKPIPGLPYPVGYAEMEPYIKIQADLTVPETVSAAIEQSGAKRAFIYLVHQSKDHMRGTIQALKDGGVETVVFLSSYTVSGDLASIKQEDVIDWAHAQVELNLEAIFGKENYIALRPGSFASNELQYKPYFRGEKDNVVKITFPRSKIDCIVPEDIGRVGGTILAKGVPGDGNRAIYLYGPQFISAHQSVATIAKVLGKEQGLKVEDVDPSEAKRILMEEIGYPALLADYFVRHANAGTGAGDELFGRRVDPKDWKNVEKYSGVKATTFEEYVRENREKFLS